MEETQGRLSKGFGTGLPVLTVSPTVYAHSLEKTERPQLESWGASTPKMESLGSPKSADGDLDCLVCCNRYSCDRLPKVLACQHAFCAVCLKLLLTIQEDSWIITCPLCRKATSVPGGLIFSLRDQEEILGRLGRLNPEVRLSPQELAQSTGGEVPGTMEENSEATTSANQVAARRLIVHLLLLVLLISLILPFVYPGVIRWVLISLMCLALLLSFIFCCLPGCRGCCHSPARTLLPVQQKHSHVASIA